MSKLVSVVIPVYNHGNYIEEAINSIVSQTYQNIELLVLDDGSSDDSFEKTKAMQNICEQRFARTSLGTQENQGLCTTLNSLIANANGDYIYIMASDDLARPEAIEILLGAIDGDDEYALAVGDNEMIDDDSNLIFWDKDRNPVYEESQAGHKTFAGFLKYKRPEIDFLSDDYGSYKSLLKGNYITNGYLIRTSIFKKIPSGPYSKKAPLEDHYLMLQISKVSKLKFVDKTLFSYRWHDENTVKDKEKMRRFGRQNMLYEQDLVNASDDIEIKKIFSDYVNRKRYIIKIRGLFSLYKIKSIDCKYLYMSILKKDFCLSRKKIS